jgi:hypothetical protein
MEETSKEIMKQEEAERLAKEMQEKTNLDKIAELLKDNKIEFLFKDKEYRAHLLTFKDKEELDELRRKKFGQLIQDKDILMEKDLIAIYKERGINIPAMDEKMHLLEAEQISLQIKLGEALSKKADEAVLKAYKGKIESLQAEISTIVIQKSQLLEYTLENQLSNFVAKVITYLAIDILENDEWTKVFKTFEDFQSNAEDEYINTAAKYALVLQYM